MYLFTISAFPQALTFGIFADDRYYVAFSHRNLIRCYGRVVVNGAAVSDGVLLRSP